MKLVLKLPQICFLPDADIIMTSMRYFVGRFSHAFQLWRLVFGTALNNVQLTDPLTIAVHDSKYAYVPKADILNTFCKLICIDKQAISIPVWHLLSLNIFM